MNTGQINDVPTTTFRQRQQNQRAMGKKSRKTAARQKFAQHQTEQDFRGMARVYFLGVGSEAMQANVRKAVYRLADKQAGGELAKFNDALAEVEAMLREIAVAYGDID